jgi:hypothetical protein
MLVWLGSVITAPWVVNACPAYPLSFDNKKSKSYLHNVPKKKAQNRHDRQSTN